MLLPLLDPWHEHRRCHNDEGGHFRTSVINVIASTPWIASEQSTQLDLDYQLLPTLTEQREQSSTRPVTRSQSQQHLIFLLITRFSFDDLLLLFWSFSPARLFLLPLYLLHPSAQFHGYVLTSYASQSTELRTRTFIDHVSIAVYKESHPPRWFVLSFWFYPAMNSSWQLPGNKQKAQPEVSPVNAHHQPATHYLGLLFEIRMKGSISLRTPRWPISQMQNVKEIGS